MAENRKATVSIEVIGLDEVLTKLEEVRQAVEQLGVTANKVNGAVTQGARRGRERAMYESPGE